MPLNIDQVSAAFPGRSIDWRVTIDSTMFEAARLANKGAPSGTVVGADEQTAGHGRYGRPWSSERDSGLYFTIILRLALPLSEQSVITLALGLAAAEAIRKTSGVACDLKWPNDVLVDGRKCAGILTQMHGGAVIAGMGVNVNQSEFPSDIAPIATSIRIACGKEQSRESLLKALLQEIDAHCDLLTRLGTPSILQSFERASTYVSGRRVTVDLPDGAVTGVTAGLTPEGFLKLRHDDGREEIVVAGGILPDHA